MTTNRPAKPFKISAENGIQIVDVDGNILVTINAAGNIVIGATAGISLGTATTQKVSLHGVTPVVQAVALTTANASALNTGDATSDTVIGNIRTRLAELALACKNKGITA